MVYGWVKFPFWLENPMQNWRTDMFWSNNLMTDRDIWKIPKVTNSKLDGHVTYMLCIAYAQ